MLAKVFPESFGAQSENWRQPLKPSPDNFYRAFLKHGLRDGAHGVDVAEKLPEPVYVASIAALNQWEAQMAVALGISPVAFGFGPSRPWRERLEEDNILSQLKYVGLDTGIVPSLVLYDAVSLAVKFSFLLSFLFHLSVPEWTIHRTDVSDEVIEDFRQIKQAKGDTADPKKSATNRVSVISFSFVVNTYSMEAGGYANPTPLFRSVGTCLYPSGDRILSHGGVDIISPLCPQQLFTWSTFLDAFCRRSHSCELFWKAMPSRRLDARSKRMHLD